MHIVDGWHCPDLLSSPGKYLRRAHEDSPRTIALCKHRRVAIQAGGHVGTWPVVLAAHFETIYTFEPTPDNFECLVRNVAKYYPGQSRVFAARGALGNKRGPIEMFISGKNTGQHRARKPSGDGAGTVPVYRIDDLALPHVDAIFLDLEGYEQHALMGAVETLKRCRPVVMAEINKRAQEQGFRLGALETFMRGAGYRVQEHVMEDVIFVHD